MSCQLMIGVTSLAYESIIELLLCPWHDSFIMHQSQFHILLRCDKWNLFLQSCNSFKF